MWATSFGARVKFLFVLLILISVSSRADDSSSLTNKLRQLHYHFLDANYDELKKSILMIMRSQANNRLLVSRSLRYVDRILQNRRNFAINAPSDKLKSVRVILRSENRQGVIRHILGFMFKGKEAVSRVRVHHVNSARLVYDSKAEQDTTPQGQTFLTLLPNTLPTGLYEIDTTHASGETKRSVFIITKNQPNEFPQINWPNKDKKVSLQQLRSLSLSPFKSSIYEDNQYLQSASHLLFDRNNEEKPLFQSHSSITGQEKQLQFVVPAEITLSPGSYKLYVGHSESQQFGIVELAYEYVNSPDFVLK